jgi:ubiquinone/menaquinone biosynthesis C-methylase UbiE
MEISAFKQQVAQDWAGDDTAAAWQKHFPQMREQMAAVTNALVEAAQPQPGMRILDLASGNGEPALSLARRVAPNGHVMATDLNERMLSALRANAAADEVTNIDTKVCDAHELPFADGNFDLVTSRFGVMFFADTPGALREIKRVLKSGGRAAFLVWGPPGPARTLAQRHCPSCGGSPLNRILMARARCVSQSHASSRPCSRRLGSRMLRNAVQIFPRRTVDHLRSC